MSNSAREKTMKSTLIFFFFFFFHYLTSVTFAVVRVSFAGVVVLGVVLSLATLVWLHLEPNSQHRQSVAIANALPLTIPSIAESIESKSKLTPTTTTTTTTTNYDPFTETPIWKDIIYRKRLDQWRAEYDAMRNDAESAAELKRVKKVRMSKKESDLCIEEGMLKQFGNFNAGRVQES
jgi:hypothetical protein